MKLLKQPIQINNIELSNRLVMPPMATEQSDDGKVTQALLDYYDEKTKGGYIGLVITEHAYIRQDGKAGKGQLSISRDSDIEGLKSLVDVIHKNGSKVIAQMNHAGSATNDDISGCPRMSSSAVVNPRFPGEEYGIPKEMSKEDIEGIVKCFSDAARRAKAAGFDGVEIHSAHAYMLNQFYSPLTNKRTDAYGGTVENRVKIHCEVIRAVREAVGEDYLVALRLGASDYMDGGSTFEDGAKAAELFEKAGLDLIDISGGFNGYRRTDNKEPGYFGDAAIAIKEKVSIPVILTGGVRDAEAAERLLEENKADLIGVGRAIYKDSNWAKQNMA